MSKNSESSLILGNIPEYMHFSGLFAAKALFPERESWFLSSGASVLNIWIISLFFNE